MGRFIVFLYSFATLAPFLSCRSPPRRGCVPSGRMKKAPVPPAGTKRSHDTSLVTTQRAEIRQTRLACDGGHSDGAYSRACDPLPVAPALGPRLRGDVLRDVVATSQPRRSLLATLPRVLFPFTAFDGRDDSTQAVAMRGRTDPPRRRYAGRSSKVRQAHHMRPAVACRGRHLSAARPAVACQTRRLSDARSSILSIATLFGENRSHSVAKDKMVRRAAPGNGA